MQLRTVAVALGFAGALSGCWCTSMHVPGAPAVPPDEQYQTGSTHGYDVFVWRCFAGRHVVVSQFSAEMTCGFAHLESSACGTLSEVEKQSAGEPRRPITRW
jgi:hypothetical protein